MSKTFVPQTIVIGARRRIDPNTDMPYPLKGGSLDWDMPTPIQHVYHTNYIRNKKKGERVSDPIKVPVYRGTTASYARWVKGQIRRQRRQKAQLELMSDTSMKPEGVEL